MSPEREFMGRLEGRADHIADELIAKARGEAIKKQRDLLKMSQGDLAAAVEVSVASVSKWESGKATPRPSVQKKIAAALCVRHSMLFGLD